MYSYVATFFSSFFPDMLDEASQATISNQGTFLQIRPGCGKSVHVRMPCTICGYNMENLRNKNKDKKMEKSPKKRRKIFEHKEFAS
jgi:hypothetical protein